MHIFERRECAHKHLDIVAIDATEVSKAETLKEVAILQNAVLNGIAHLATHT